MTKQDYIGGILFTLFVLGSIFFILIQIDQTLGTAENIIGRVAGAVNDIIK